MRPTLQKRVRRCVVRQLDGSDCGPACLASIIQFFGGHETIERIRELTGTGPNGTTLLGLLKSAPALGLAIEGFEADTVGLQTAGCPCILHVVTAKGSYHYVVCFGHEAGRFVIVDPAVGLKFLTAAELESIWTSRALLTVRRSGSFTSRRTRSAEKRRWLFDSIKEDVHSLALAVLLGALISTFGLAVALFSQALIDDILPNRERLKLGVGLGLVGFFLLAQNALTAVRQMILLRQARAFNNRIIKSFLDSLVGLPFPFFATRQAGDLISRLNDTGRLQRFVTFAIGSVMINILMLITAMAFILVYSSTIGLWVIGGLVLLALSAALSHRRIVAGQVGVMSARAVNESRYVDTIRGMEAVKAANAERIFAAKMKGTFSALQDAVYRLGRIGVSFNFTAQLAGLAVVLGVMGFGAAYVFSGALQVGELVALIQMTNMLIPAAYGLAISNIELQEASVAFDRMYQFTSLEQEDPSSFKPEESSSKPEESSSKPEESSFLEPGESSSLEPGDPSSLEPEDSTHLDPEDAEAPTFDASSAAIPWVERLEVENLSYRFAGRAPLFSNVSFAVARGEIVLLIGTTGSGKSTLLRILLRLYLAESGTVLVNGRDWSYLPTHVWRSIAAMVPQHVQVFSGTLAENICMRPVRRTERVEQFCRGLGLDAAFRRLPHGYVTLLGEGGVGLSGGQQRLLGLSRALYRRPQILLVDELITGLDPKTARHAVGIIRRQRRDMATLVVSHRDDFTGLAGRAYRLENGTVREAADPRTVNRRPPQR